MEPGVGGERGEDGARAGAAGGALPGGGEGGRKPEGGKPEGGRKREEGKREKLILREPCSLFFFAGRTLEHTGRVQFSEPRASVQFKTQCKH